MIVYDCVSLHCSADTPDQEKSSGGGGGVCKLIITSNLTVAKDVLNSWLGYWLRIGLDFDNMFGLGCPTYATEF